MYCVCLCKYNIFIHTYKYLYIHKYINKTVESLKLAGKLTSVCLSVCLSFSQLSLVCNVIPDIIFQELRNSIFGPPSYGDSYGPIKSPLSLCPSVRPSV